MKDLICIKTYHKRIDADMAKSFLEANGIEAEVFADDCGTLRPHLLVGSSGARIMIKEEDTQEAADLLEEFDNNEGP